MPITIFSENELLNQVVTTLNTAGFVSHNKFGNETNLDNALKQIGHIYCFMEGADYDAQTFEAMAVELFLQFWTIDQSIATLSTKADYTSDLLRDYLLSSWRKFAIDTKYTSLKVDAFRLVSERTQIDIETFNKITIFRGAMTIIRTAIT